MSVATGPLFSPRIGPWPEFAPLSGWRNPPDSPTAWDRGIVRGVIDTGRRGFLYAPIEKSVRGIYRNILAGLRRMRQRGAGRGFPESRHRLRGGGSGVRPHGPDDGVCDRPHLGLPLESRRLGGLGGGQAISRSELPAYVIAQVLGRHRCRRPCCTSSPAAKPGSTWQADSPPTATARIHPAATPGGMPGRPKWC